MAGLSRVGVEYTILLARSDTSFLKRRRSSSSFVAVTKSISRALRDLVSPTDIYMRKHATTTRRPRARSIDRSIETTSIIDVPNSRLPAVSAIYAKMSRVLGITVYRSGGHTTTTTPRALGGQQRDPRSKYIQAEHHHPRWTDCLTGDDD